MYLGKMRKAKRSIRLAGSEAMAIAEFIAMWKVSGRRYIGSINVRSNRRILLEDVRKSAK
jgi:hypothetical protein